MEKVSELVWLYVKRRPFLKENIREGTINYSALARKIAIDALGDKKHTNAIKMALVRLTKKMAKKEEDLEERILKILKKSSISVRTKIAVIISTKELEDIDYLSYVEGKGFVTYILEEKKLEKIRKSKRIISSEQNLNLIIIHSPPDVEETPGVIAHILNSLAAEGINVVEFVSCYTDTLLVIKQADTTRTYELLSILTS